MPNHEEVVNPNIWGRPKRRASAIWLVALLVVVAMTGIWIYILDSGVEKATKTQALVQPAAVETEQAAPERIIQTLPREGDAARAVIAEIRNAESSPSLDDVYMKSREFRTTGHYADAHLLLFFNARQGHAASALALGKMYDPKYHSAANSIVDQPDIAQAYKWYSFAASADDPVAQNHLIELKRLVTAEAMQGDENANLLLMRWQ